MAAFNGRPPAPESPLPAGEGWVRENRTAPDNAPLSQNAKAKPPFPQNATKKPPFPQNATKKPPFTLKGGFSLGVGCGFRNDGRDS